MCASVALANSITENASSKIVFRLLQPSAFPSAVSLLKLYSRDNPLFALTASRTG
jgi:hypothetical protein